MCLCSVRVVLGLACCPSVRVKEVLPNEVHSEAVLYKSILSVMDHVNRDSIIFSKKVFLIHPIFFFVVYTGKMVNYGDME